MNTKVAVVERANALVESGLDRKKVIATLVLEDYTPKEISEAFPASEKKVPFREMYFNYLVDNTPTDEEAKAWIESYPDISKNEIAHINVRLKEAALVRRVRASVEE